MKIENGNKTDLLDSLVKTAQVKPQKETAVGKPRDEEANTYDRVELSARNQEVNRLREKVRAQPAVRQERVEELKQSIEDGTYNAKGEFVAGSILKSNILDELL